MSWQEKRYYHTQMEVLMNYLLHLTANILPMVPPALSMLAAASSVMLLHMGWDGGEYNYYNYPIFAGFLSGSWVGGFGVLHLLEQMVEVSGAALKDIEGQIRSESVSLSMRGRGTIPKRSFPERLFRRRVLRIRMGAFYYIEPGFALDFFQMTVDNIVTYSLVVNTSEKMWLI